MPTLHIRLFGAFQVTVDGQPWDHFRSDKVRALLAYLAVEGATPRRRSQLMTLLWPGFKPTFARANLRMTLTNLRPLLAPFDLLQSTRQTVHWCTFRPNYICDALALEDLLQAAASRPATVQWQAIEHLYQGEFLPGFEQIDSLPWQLWVQEKRAYYANQISELRQRLLPSPAPVTAPDWGAIPRAPQFCGRHRERATLRQWTVDEDCHLVAIFGMGGQGKTALAATLVRDLAGAPAVAQPPSTPRFAHIIWRSLGNAPPLTEIMLSWLHILANQQVAHLPALVEDQLTLLISYLRAQPVLLVLDQLESILQSSGQAGSYRPGYENYSELLRRVAVSDHQSCLLLTSREQPQEFHRLQTHEPTIRALHLSGLTQHDGQQMVHACGLYAPAGPLTTLLQRYSGNPLALQVATETIQELFDGKIADFLAQAPLILDEMRTVLEQQFARLSALEQTILIWLAIEGEPITREVLLAKLVAPPPRSAYLEAERSLLRRFLVETSGGCLGLPNLVREYLTNHLINQICWELRPAQDEIGSTTPSTWPGQTAESTVRQSWRGESPMAGLRAWPFQQWIADSYLNRYNFSKDQPKAYLCESQRCPILRSLAEQLVAHYGQARVVSHLHSYLTKLQQEPAPGYAATNILHLSRLVGDEFTTLQDFHWLRAKP